MGQTKVFFFAILAISLLSFVTSRPHHSANQHLANIAAELTQTLTEALELIQTDQSPSRRRRRMVQLYVARAHHHPRHYHRSRRGRRPYRAQRGGRIADISDH